VVTGDEAAPVLHRWLLPVEGQAVRALERRDEAAIPFGFPLGQDLTFEVRGPSGRTHREVVHSRIGLQGDLTLESPGLGAVLWYENQGRQFVIYDHAGRRESVLHLLAAAAPRVPYEATPGLSWDDVLPRRRLRPAWARWLTDLLEPFLPDGGIPLALTAARRGPVLEVRGSGLAGRRPLRTLALFDAMGPTSIEVRVGGEVHGARRIDEALHA
jgi:hypothetical protein